MVELTFQLNIHNNIMYDAIGNSAKHDIRNESCEP
jgi:hypothetical protein